MKYKRTSKQTKKRLETFSNICSAAINKKKIYIEFTRRW